MPESFESSHYLRKETRAVSNVLASRAQHRGRPTSALEMETALLESLRNARVALDRATRHILALRRMQNDGNPSMVRDSRDASE